MKTVLLVSGGLDSFIAYHYLVKDGYEVLPLHINYQGIYSDKELSVVEELFPNVRIDNSLDFFGQEIGEKAFLKNRNAFFALIGSKYGNSICMAGLKDDNVGDKSQTAFLRMQELLDEINTGDHHVFSPFWGMEKEEIVKWFMEEQLSLKELCLTTSCYHPELNFCGKCPSCFRKYCAFVSNDIGDYIPAFTNFDLALEYKTNIFKYSMKRQASILRACKVLGV